jgi:NAD(P)-dependent dehydrogenase (short-subunit alcohol dehydrogenase family)
MKEGSSIINISSIVGMIPLRNQCAFTAAKAGVINFTKAVAMELAPKGIRANVICPGTIGIQITNKLWTSNSAMEGLLSHIPMGRQGLPEEIADVTAFLASSAASYITGAVLPVDGGWTCGGFARNF